MLLSNNALDNKEVKKLNQYKALRTFVAGFEEST